MAISRQKKEATVSTLKEKLSSSLLAVNLKYQGLTVKEVQDFKRTLPEDAKLIVAKNSLLKIAANEVRHCCILINMLLMGLKQFKYES